MLQPAYLKKGDKIGIIAPARKISPAETAAAIDCFKSWGLEVIESTNLYSSDNQFAGTDTKRKHDLLAFVNDPNIKAIACARGGYGTIRLLDINDALLYRKNPKWIIGYSDITALHGFLNRQCNMQSIHGIMPVNVTSANTSKPAVQTLRDILFGGKPEYRLKNHNYNKAGTATGRLIGGNLSMLYSMNGTPFYPATSGNILFLEDLDEYLYHIDRMMMTLKMNGTLGAISGLVVGGMTDMRDNTIPFGEDAETIIHRIMQTYNIPVAFNFPAGHHENNQAFIHGAEVRLQVNDADCVLEYL